MYGWLCGGSLLLVASIFVIGGSYLTTLLLLLFRGAGGLFSHQVVLRLSLNPTPLRTPSSVWIKLGAGLHGWLNTEYHSGPPISQRERLIHNESSFICTSSIIIPIVSSSTGMLSVKFSMQRLCFSCFHSIIPIVWQFPHSHTPLWLYSIQASSQQHRGRVRQPTLPEQAAKVLTSINNSKNTDIRKKMQRVHDTNVEEKNNSGKRL